MTFHIGSPHTRGAGYFINGVQSTRPHEDDVWTCAHCQKVLFLARWKDQGGWCRREMKPLCLPCADRAITFGCQPFLKTLEAYTKSQVKQSQFAKVAAAMPPLIINERT